MVAAALALCSAALITWTTAPMSATERIIRIEAADALPHLTEELEGWPVAVNAALLGYAGDKRLLLSAQLALASYPAAAESVLGMYGTNPEFKRVLRHHGAAVVLPIQYFLANESLMLELRHRMASAFGDPPERPPAGQALPDDNRLTAAERGWYAIGLIEEQGHDFLGQFVVAPARGEADGGEISWVQSERFATGAKRFFTSGITSLERKWHLDQDIGAGDVAWAAVDALVPIAALRIAKVARAGRLARAGGRSLRLARPLGLAATVGTAGYLITHPSLVGDVARGVAEALSLPAWLVELAVWFALLLPLLIVARMLRRWLIRPVLRAVSVGIGVLLWARRRLQPTGQVS